MTRDEVLRRFGLLEVENADKQIMTNLDSFFRNRGFSASDHVIPDLVIYRKTSCDTYFTAAIGSVLAQRASGAHLFTLQVLPHLDMPQQFWSAITRTNLTWLNKQRVIIDLELEETARAHGYDVR
jgi:hypothetical protein